MKKLLPVLCVLALLLCGCNSRPQAPTMLTLTVDPLLENGEQALEYFGQIVDCALEEGGYTHLVCTSNAYRPREVTFTDKEFIRSVLSKLQDLKASSVESTPVMTGALPSVGFYLGYEKGRMALCSITESTLCVSYETNSLHTIELVGFYSR